MTAQIRLSDAEFMSNQGNGLTIPDHLIPGDMLNRMGIEIDDLIARHPDVWPEFLSDHHILWGRSA